MTYEALKARGIVNGLVQIEPFMEADVPEVARLRLLTKAIGLSLGDRACLALGRKLGLPVFTADQAWENVGVAVEVRLVR
jgi:ribonuclease VapC